MGKKTKIEWTDATWNPLRGCTRVSEGCRNCYAENISARFSGPGEPYEGFATFRRWTENMVRHADAQWTGKVQLIENKLYDPIRWNGSLRIFVNSMSDLFHEAISDAEIDRIFCVMALCPRHHFQVLTKRVERMAQYMGDARHPESILKLCMRENRGRDRVEPDDFFTEWPLENLWLGASAENQESYDARRADLEATRSVVRWWSLEPLLAPIRLGLAQSTRKPDWVVVGGESGADARPTNPDWVRRIRDECVAEGVPFFFKQWGEWVAVDQNRQLFVENISKEIRHTFSENTMVFHVGKHDAGRLLDGEEWNQAPPYESSAAILNEE